jgi:hypothetical protein
VDWYNGLAAAGGHMFMDWPQTNIIRRILIFTVKAAALWNV